MNRWLSLVVLLLWNRDFVGSIRILDLRVPGHAAEGGSALLGCEYDLEGDELYSVKWYKNGREFFRYVPNNNIPISHFPTNGVTVDVGRSSSTVVALTNLKASSGGYYRCEVSGEAPQFATVSDEKYVTIQYLPKTTPYLKGLKDQYNIGDRLGVLCISGGSRPEAQLEWLVNDKAVSKQHTAGPWYKWANGHQNTSQTILELRFTIMPRHFKNGVLSIKCQAVIAPLYQDEVVHHIVLGDNFYSTMAEPIAPEEVTLPPPPVYNEVKDTTPESIFNETSVDNASAHRMHLTNIFVILLCFRFMLCLFYTL